MKYDIVTKRLLTIGKEQILRDLLGIDVDSAELILELPTELPSMRSSDFAMHVKIRGGSEYILILELQTHWRPEKALRLLEYMLRYQEKFPDLQVIPSMLLLLPNRKASDFYQNQYLTFKFNLINLSELEASEYIDTDIEILPFIPLMQGGLEYVEIAERKIVDSKKTAEMRGDLIAALTILTALLDKDHADKIFRRRNNIMIESPAYELFLQEGLEKGMERGMEEGIEKGKQIGLEEGKLEGKLQGKLETARKMVEKGLSPELIIQITGLSAEELQHHGVL